MPEAHLARSGSAIAPLRQRSRRAWGIGILLSWSLVAGAIGLAGPARSAAEPGLAEQAVVEGTATAADPTAADRDLAMDPRATRRAREGSLIAILVARRQVEQDLKALQAELQSSQSRGRETEIEAAIRKRADDLAHLAESFSELATGVDPTSLDASPEPTRFDLAQELRTLLAPLVNELKRATSRPREIDRLRTEIADLSDQLETVDGALARLDVVADAAKDESLKKALASERSDWARRRAAIEAGLDVALQKLASRTAEHRSIRETVREVFEVFFKSRGRNLLLALVAMASFLIVLRRIRTFVAQRARPAANGPTFRWRIFGLVYSVFSVVGSVAVFVVALYFFGDWVLLILALLLILGLIWASKQALPRFWSQAVLILDMGAVREGQRVIYDGLPWRVDSIGFYCSLSNPALVGGAIRIPIEDVAELRSRPDRADEPFFPTREGDVVLLPDGRPARVEFQSTETVRLCSPGGNRRVVPARIFASEPVEVLSSGYRVDVGFGLDYRSQAESTTTTRARLESEIARRWRDSAWADSLVSVAVEFSAAGPSSLDYFVRVDLDGSQAFDYAAQRRHLARLCVEVCNDAGWVIPFQQLTVHVARDPAG